MNSAGRETNEKHNSVQDTALRILLVDFDDSRRRSRVQMLESVGYEVETAPIPSPPNDWIMKGNLIW